MKTHTGRMKTLRISAVAVAAASLALLGSGPSVATAGGAVFDTETVAKRWNFSYTGTGKDGTSFAAVGWFDVNSSGSITDGQMDLTVAGAFVQHRISVPLSSSAGLNTFTLKNGDTTNGRYTLDVGFGTSESSVRLILHVLLEDARGRSGKANGQYIFSVSIPSADSGSGVGSAEITAQ